jgi:adenine deaminase
MDSINLPEKILPQDFAVKTKNKDGLLKVRVISMVTDLVTREVQAQLKVDSGEIFHDPDRDIIKVAAIDRARSSGKIFTGFIKGFGLKQGALACSASWDTSCIIVVGENENDMAKAVNRIRELKGGAVVCADGKISGEIAMPVFGIMADMPLKDIAKGLSEVRRAAAGIGVPFHDPLLSLTALTGAAIPFIRVCEQGLVSLKDGKTLGLVAENTTDI